MSKLDEAPKKVAELYYLPKEKVFFSSLLLYLLTPLICNFFTCNSPLNMAINLISK